MSFYKFKKLFISIVFTFDTISSLNGYNYLKDGLFLKKYKKICLSMLLF